MRVKLYLAVIALATAGVPLACSDMVPGGGGLSDSTGGSTKDGTSTAQKAGSGQTGGKAKGTGGQEDPADDDGSGDEAGGSSSDAKGGSSKVAAGGRAGVGGQSARGGSSGNAGSSKGGGTSGAVGGASGKGGASGGGGSARGGSAGGGEKGKGGAIGAAGAAGAAAGGAKVGVGGSSGTAGAAGGTGGGSTSTCETDEEKLFSFFLVSQEALTRESGKTDGFGGNLGGLSGADKICQKVAESVSPCQSSKVWHAFLSTSTANAIERIGTGPWYDRLGRLLANNKTELLDASGRPPKADAAIKNDFPNEFGVPNHAPKNGQQVDNHEILTGTGTDGKVYTQSTTSSGGGMGMGMGMGDTACGTNEQWTQAKATCWDWTSSEGQGCPRVGHSWPRQGSGINWISCWNEGGCLPGGTTAETGGLDGTRRVGSAGGYGGFYCFAVTP